MIVLGGVAWQVSATAHVPAAASPASQAIPAADTDTGAAMADRVMGNANAPVTIVEYFSLTCPHCADFEQETFPKLKADYIDTGKVRYIARDFPFDRAGLRAAMMARCAPAERYFPLVDLLFKDQKNWGLATDPEASMTPLGRFAGMSQDQITACFANKDLENFVVKERTDAQAKYKVDSTPNFIFNDGAEQFSGSQDYEKFKTTIDELLARK
jgi:protein-disulfide isomerase